MGTKKAVFEFLLMLAVGAGMFYLSFLGLQNYFPTIQSAIYAGLITVAIGMSGYKIVDAWCNRRRALAFFYGGIAGGAIIVAGQTDGLTWAAGITHEGGDRAREIRTASAAAVKSETLLSAKADLEAERTAIDTLRGEIAQIEEVHASFAATEAQIQQMKTDGYRATTEQAKVLQAELDAKRASVLPAPELAGKRAVLEGAIKREAQLMAQVATLQAETDQARAEEKTADESVNIILAYAQRFSTDETTNEVDETQATAFIFAHGWIVWQIMEVFFAALAGGIAYENHQRRRTTVKATVDTGKPTDPPRHRKAAPREEMPDLVSHRAERPSLAAFVPDGGGRNEQSELFEEEEIANPIAQQLQRRVPVESGNFNLPERLWQATVEQVRRGLARHDMDMILRRFNNRFDLGYKSREIDWASNEVSIQTMRGLLHGFDDDLTMGEILSGDYEVASNVVELEAAV